MELSELQKKGLDIAIKRYKAGERYTVISGVAGSGKSTLVKFIVSALQIPEENIVYATFTGKAAQVLLDKGNKNVSTLHKLLYKSFPLPDGGYSHLPVDIVPYTLVIVDECSMMPREIMQLLLSYPVHCIFLGDPEQLPPINPDDDNHLLDKPHIFLHEVHRQALDSEIIKLSMDIREGRPIENFDGKDVKVFNSNALTTGMLLWADQIICATNKTRIEINNQMRELLGREGVPQDGDKIICLSNYWNYLAHNENPLVNGTIGYLKSPYASYRRYPYFINGGGSFDVTVGGFVSDTGADFGELVMDTNMILTGEPGLDWKTKYALMRNKKLNHLIPLEFTYGYAITGHRSQGSQWGKVLVIEERFPFDKIEHKRWLYTTCTRPSDKLVVIRKD